VIAKAGCVLSCGDEKRFGSEINVDVKVIAERAVLDVVGQLASNSPHK
jgi:hypothetical protein